MLIRTVTLHRGRSRKRSGVRGGRMGRLALRLPFAGPRHCPSLLPHGSWGARGRSRNRKRLVTGVKPPLDMQTFAWGVGDEVIKIKAVFNKGRHLSLCHSVQKAQRYRHIHKHTRTNTCIYKHTHRCTQTQSSLYDKSHTAGQLPCGWNQSATLITAIPHPSSVLLAL